MTSTFMEERNRAILDVARSGLTYGEIGKNFHVSKQRIGQICKDAGLRKRIDLFKPMEENDVKHV